MKILERKDNKVVGYKDGKLYNGKEVTIGFDELEEKVTKNKDGSVTKKVVHGDYVHGVGTYNKPEKASEMELKVWESNLTPQEQKKAYQKVLVDGEITEVEKKLTYIDWKEA